MILMSTDTLVLSLDIASSTGYALARPSDLAAGRKPISGSIRLGAPGASPAEKGWAFIRWLGEFCTVHRPRVLVYEAPLPTSRAQGNSTNSTAFMLMGLAFVAISVAYGFGIYTHHAVHASTVRKHFIGKGNTPRKEAKAKTIAKCKQLGWEPKGDDEADALAILSYQCSQMGVNIPVPLPVTALFEGESA